MAIFITNLNSVLTYGVTATNDGNVTQHNVIVTDSKITPNSATCASLAPAATCVLSGSHNVTQAELDAEQVDNTSSVTSALLPVAESVTLSTPVVKVSSLVILKAVVANSDADGCGTITTDEVLSATKLSLWRQDWWCQDDREQGQKHRSKSDRKPYGKHV